MKKNWIKPQDRRYDVSKTEKKFEEIVSQNGFSVIGVKEFIGKTDYLLERDGIWVESSIYMDKDVNANKIADMVIKSFTTKRELEELRRLLN